MSDIVRPRRPRIRFRAVEFYLFDLESGCVGAFRATPGGFVSNDDRRALHATPLRRHASILRRKTELDCPGQTSQGNRVLNFRSGEVKRFVNDGLFAAVDGSMLGRRTFRQMP
ncbi:MAG: hypothetical protein LBM75_06490, partial [Myxococcales bacterium]|nr:hypothetical protein [Myxococcales bacterium]